MPNSERILTPQADIVEQLKRLADDMERIAVKIGCYGGSKEWSLHGRELAGAATIARQWADEIDVDSDDLRRSDTDL